MIVLIINGAPRTGKDTFIKLLQKINKERVIAYSSIDWVKHMAHLMGWDGEKDTKGRQFLSDIKDACTDYADIPFKKIIKTIKAHYEFTAITPKYCCVNIRETLEIQKLVAWCTKENIPCHTVWIRNKKAEQKALDSYFISNGDTQYMDHNYDLVINNDGTLMDFEIEIEIKINTLEKVAA